MKLIADSGGTKTAWFLVHEGQAYPGPESSGINLNVISAATAKAGIAQTILPALKERPVEELHFYGAGLGTSSHVETMRELLTSLFPTVHIGVYHDLLGAARATCGDEAGTVCILGTGSNACRFDGMEITAQRGGHGWILSDEGGGTDLGKQLLKAALDEELPADLLTAFQQYVGVGLIDLRTAIYRSERPNTALARLAPFLALHRSHAFVAAFPMEDPQYIVLSIVDEPKPEKPGLPATAGMNAAPIVANIIRRSASMLGVKPEFGHEKEATVASTE